MDNIARIPFFATPPLRYVGAKWQIADWIIASFPPHELYCEPFAGSASVFFRKHRSPVEVLNDLDGELVNFFRVLRDHTDELVFKIRLTPWSEEEYHKSFEPCEDELERARRFYVSVWQSFGSTLIYKSGWRRHKTAAMRTPVVDTWRRIDGILAAANRLMDAQISSQTASECIKYWDGKKTLFYVDPPYVHSSRANGGRNRYRHEMTDEEHRELAVSLKEVEGMVLLSGYHSDLYDELYTDWYHIEKSSTTNGNGTSTEVLWISPNAQNVDRLPLFNLKG